MDSVLKWHGGKSYLAPWIVSHFPVEYTHYVEPYFGSGRVLLELPPGKSEVGNDLNGDLIHFFVTLSDPLTRDEFIRRANTLPFHQTLWENAGERWPELSGASGDSVWRALLFFIRMRQSYQGIGRTFAARTRSRTRGGRNAEVNAWMGAVDNLLPVATRLLDVLWLSMPAIDVIRAEDSPDTLFYLDPPYHPDTRTVRDVYEYEMSDADHRALLVALRMVRGKVALSGYRCPLYDEMLTGWTRFDREIDNKSGRTHEKRTESLWCNYAR